MNKWVLLLAFILPLTLVGCGAVQSVGDAIFGAPDAQGNTPGGLDEPAKGLLSHIWPLGVPILMGLERIWAAVRGRQTKRGLHAVLEGAEEFLESEDIYKALEAAIREWDGEDKRELEELAALKVRESLKSKLAKHQSKNNVHHVVDAHRRKLKHVV